jgi:crotonobetainyl-CoA:carnitine CoA-transferase CaiB-like acyl-CoA transferase
MAPLVTHYGVPGEVQERLGGGIFSTVPRNTYRTADDRWIAVSSSSDSVAARLLELVGLDGDDRLATFAGRVAHRKELDELLADWMAQRTAAEALAEFERAGAAAAAVYDMSDIFADEHVRSRGSIVELDGLPMQGLLAHLSATPGRLRWAGPPLPGSDAAPPGGAAGLWDRPQSSDGEVTR